MWDGTVWTESWMRGVPFQCFSFLNFGVFVVAGFAGAGAVMRIRPVWGYCPSVRRKFYSRFGNGFTLWVGLLAVHFILRPAKFP